jgi:hypothetical protein
VLVNDEGKDKQAVLLSVLEEQKFSHERSKRILRESVPIKNSSKTDQLQVQDANDSTLATIVIMK